MNKNYIPERLEYKDKSIYKCIQKKRTRFRKDAKNNYLIIDNRLHYKYKINGKIFELKIPYQYEKNILLYNIHIENNHASINNMQKLIISEGFYWEGFSKEIKKFINNCPFCTVKIQKKIKLPLKQIIDSGPHYRYQGDIWYLSEELKTNNNYLYCLDLIDHFSKWAESYLLKDKSMLTVLSKIKLFILNNGKCKIFQSDNGTEFRNNELKVYFENEGITHVFSMPRHPQSNGCIESFHKKVQKFLYMSYQKDKKNFDIEVELSNFLVYYNNSVHDVTKKIPAEIKNLNDKEEIDEITFFLINIFIIKNYFRFILFKII